MGEPKMKWYARARGILWMGPYETQEKAWAAVMAPGGVPAPEAAVWCSVKAPTAKPEFRLGVNA